MKNLSDIKPGENAVIKNLKCEGALRRRLLDMGITPNTHIHMIKTAPLGDPLEIRLRGYVLTIRKEDARMIEISYINLQ